jgi:hypothetical protein
MRKSNNSRLRIDVRDLEAFKKVLETGERCFPVMGRLDSESVLDYSTLMRVAGGETARVTLTESLDTPAHGTRSMADESTYHRYTGFGRTSDDTVAVENSRSRAMRVLRKLGVGDEQLKAMTTVKVKTLKSMLVVHESEDREVTTYEDERVPSRWTFEVEGPLRALRCTAHLDGSTLRFVIDVPDLAERRKEEIDRKMSKMEAYLGEPVLAGSIDG